MVLSMFDLIAHRGASKEAPENTMSAFKRAVEIGADWIELDVHLTADHVPIVIHDPFLGRTTNGHTQQRVTELTLAELKTLDAGIWFGTQFAGEKIPTLDEVLAFNRSRKGLMIELKKGHTPSRPLVEAVLDSLEKAPKNGPICLGSFSRHILEEIREHTIDIPLIGILEDINLIDTFLSLRLPRLAIWYKLLNPALIEQIHSAGSKVWAFTVDDPQHAAFLTSIGVDGLISNDPKTMIGLPLT